MTGAARGRARVGCSGWMYQDWREVFYPATLPARAWFAHYAKMFDTVELNSTFYRLPRTTTVARWSRAAPPGFLYAVKLGGFGTHRMKLRDPQRWLPNHLSTFQPLGDHLGPTLVQLPPRWRCDPVRLDEFLSAAPRTMRWVVELRDPSWLAEQVFEVLRRHGAALCLHDLLPHHPFELTARWTYVRFHGPNAMTEPYRGRYGGRRLWRIAERLQGVLENGGDVYCYFNNDHNGDAVADAAWMVERLDPGAARLRTTQG